MNIREFESLVNNRKMRIERREMHAGKEIFVCEGYCRGDRDLWAPHYKTMYAIADDPEHLNVGEFFTTEIIFPTPPKDDRIASAVERAREFIDNLGAEWQTT